MELARELRNNFHPRPSAHSPYGNSTLSPGSQGLSPDSSVLALFNASATNTRQLLPLASYPLFGAWGQIPPGLTFQNKLFTLYYRCKTVTLSLLLLPHFLPHFLRICLSPVSFLFCFWSIPVLDPLFHSPQDDEGGESGTEEKHF